MAVRELPYTISTVTMDSTDGTQFTTETSLMVENAQKENGGVYVCALTNDVTSIMAEASVYVQGMRLVMCSNHSLYNNHAHYDI